MTVALSLISTTASPGRWPTTGSCPAQPQLSIRAIASLLILVGNGLCTTPLGLALDGLPGSGELGPLGYAVAAGVLEVCGFLFFFRALQRGDLAVVAPIIGLEGGIAALTVFAFGERVGAIVVLGLKPSRCSASCLHRLRGLGAAGRGPCRRRDRVLRRKRCSRSMPPPRISVPSRS